LEEMHAEDLVDVGTKVLAKPEPFVITSFSADKRQDPAMDAVSKQYKILGRTAPQAYTAGPTAFAHRVHAAYCWAHGEWALTPANLLRDYLKQIPGGEGTSQSFWTLLLKTADFWPAVKSSHRAPIKVSTLRSDGKDGLVLSDGSWSEGALWPSRKPVTILPNVNPTGKNTSGRLALLEEAAGKVRVVALLDVWSQWALKPLHNWIFDLLSSIPEDGTFNQLKPVKKLLGKVSNDTTIYSYDLSAATDRIPVVIQEYLLAQVFGQSFAKCWRALLVGRPYWVSKESNVNEG